jgi:hypothetical protein
MTVPLQASGITGATRLTSDGQTANGFVYDAILTDFGTGYTGNPTVSVSAGTGPVVHAAASGGGIIADVGVYTPGSAVPAEATASVSGGGGSGGAISLGVAGNTINLPIGSTNTVVCYVSAQSVSGLSYGFTIAFVINMGATSSTTALVGSPSWSLVAPVGGTAIAMSVAADTTLGAVNITATPASGTWSVGGSCTVVSTKQVI